MKITRKNNTFVIEIEATTKRYNPYDESEDGEMDTLIGLITNENSLQGKEIGLAHRIDMAYKDKQDQVGSFVIIWHETQEEFEKMCIENKIDILKE